MAEESVFHRFIERCRNCGSELLVIAISFAAQGYVRLEFRCGKCRRESSTCMTFHDYLKRAIEADRMAEFRGLTTENSKNKIQ